MSSIIKLVLNRPELQSVNLNNTPIKLHIENIFACDFDKVIVEV
jgi:hypothetical protein